MREFSAPDGCIVVPLWIMRALGVSFGSRLRIEHVHMPRGTFARLQPIFSNELEALDEPKATLEAALFGTCESRATGRLSAPWARSGALRALLGVTGVPARYSALRR